MTKIPLEDPRKRVAPSRTVKRRVLTELDGNGWLVAKHIVIRETNRYYVTLRREVDEKGDEIPGKIQERWVDKKKLEQESI